MIAGCIDRLRHDACGDCERRDACSDLARFFGIAGTAARARPRPRIGGGGSRGRSFMKFLGEVARAIEASSSRPRPAPLRREVERRLEAMLASGPVRIDEVAREFGLSRQTLYRRLKAEGATFEEVLDSLRHRLALRLIREEGVPVKEAAWRLGFSDPAAFSRAFKRWTGKSPAEVRRRPN